MLSAISYPDLYFLQTKLLEYRTTRNQLLSTSVQEEEPHITSTLHSLDLRSTERRFFDGDPNKELTAAHLTKRSNAMNTLIKVKNAQNFIDRVQAQVRTQAMRKQFAENRGRSKQFLRRSMRKPTNAQVSDGI